MLFYQLAEHLADIEKTSSRLAMTDKLAVLFNATPHDEIDKVLYLLQGRVSPLFVRKDFGIGEQLAIGAIVKALHLDAPLFKKKYREVGDLGKTVEHFKKGRNELFIEKPLSVNDVFEILTKITEVGGSGSQEQKNALLGTLIRKLDPLSSRYVIRIPLNTLRLGFSDMTVLDAFSWMISGNKNSRGEIEKAYHVHPDIGRIGAIIKKKGIKGLDKIDIAVFVPLIMMRAERLSDVDEIVNKAPNGIIEPKYDGFRVQVHAKKKNHTLDVKLYSRSLEDVTYMYPDIVKGVQKEILAESIIFEGEAIGIDPVTLQFLPFQETVQRKRKYGIEEMSKRIPLKLFAFEILYYNGKNLLSTSYIKRRDYLLRAVVTKNKIKKNTLHIAHGQVADSPKTVELVFDTFISEGLEGVMVKKIDGVYQPGARGWNWIKYKRSYASNINDTIDCIVMGYDSGKGKRSSFGIGAVLIGLLNKESDVIETVAKLGTGFTDNQWVEVKKRLDGLITEKKPTRYIVDLMMYPDYWVKPEVVLEIRADEITLSPVHTAGRVMKKTRSGKAEKVDVPGFALRFPRCELVRKDKSVAEATTVEELKSMFTLSRMGGISI